MLQSCFIRFTDVPTQLASASASAASGAANYNILIARVKPCLNDPTFHPTLAQHWCWVNCWIVWTQCWVTQHWHFQRWVKFDSSQTCWVTVANTSIVFKCWMKCWVVWTLQLTLLALRMRSPANNRTLFTFWSWFPVSNAQLLHSVFKL